MWYFVCAFQAATAPAWDGTWSRVPAVVGFILVAVCAYRADDSLLEGAGGGLFFVLWCWGLWTMLPPTLGLVHRKTRAERIKVARSPSVEAAVKAILEKEWDRTAKGADLFGATITDDLPASWPPNGDGRLSYLAFSYGMRPGLADAEIGGSIWGRIILDAATGKVSFQRLSKSTEKDSIQGVRPMTREETRIGDTQLEALGRLIALTKTTGAPKEADPIVRDYYCQWRELNGVAERLPLPEANFIRWLDCDHRPAAN